jgi:DNA replication protein DnaD
MRKYDYLSSQNIQGMKYIESKYGNKMENDYSHKIFIIINLNKSKYGNKFGCELEVNLSAADQSHIFYKSETNYEQIWSEIGRELLPIETQKVKKLIKS